MKSSDDVPGILYDSDCKLCNRSVEFIRKQGGEQKFRFIPLHSADAGKWLARHGYPQDYNDSVLLVDEEHLYSKSDAVFEIMRQLHTPWKWFLALKIIPRPVRDLVYNMIARIRHRHNLQY